MPRVSELLDMAGRVVLVTGGAGHIGRAAAETFAELGADIALLDVDHERCSAVSRQLAKEASVQTRVVRCNLENMTEIPSAVETVLQQFGRLDVVVNCAAFVGTSALQGWADEFSQQSPETFQRALGVNLTAPFALCQAAAPALRASDAGGVIINVSSIYGQVGPDLRLYEGLNMGNPASYAAAKGGLEQLTRWLATVLAPRVRVNAIAPGGVERGQPDDFRRRYAARTPLRRLAVEDDLRGAFAYLGSDLSRYVTGQVLNVDGGWTAW